MKTVAKLGKKIKKEYPEYRDMSDEEVGRLVKARFPGSYDDYIDVGLTQFEVQPETYLKQKGKQLDIEDSIQKIRRGDFTTGWAFFNRIRAKRAMSVAEIKAAENAIADQLIESEAKIAQARTVKRQSEVVLYEMKMQEQMRDAMHALSLLKIKVEGTLISQAAEQGFTFDTYQLLRVEEAKSNITLREQERLSEIKVNEHRALKQVDLEAWLLEKNTDIKAALISTLLPHYQAKVLTGDIFKLLDEAYQLQISNDPQKEEKLKVIQKQIKKLKKVVDGKQRLLQGDNG